MELSVLAGQANGPLAERVAAALGKELGPVKVQRFPDGELSVCVPDTVRGRDVYLLQPTGPPVESHLLELLLLADACRRAGAARLTAVVPYFGYARQDRRAGGREAVGGRLVADLMAGGGLDRVVAVDLHTAALEGFFTMPLEHLTAMPLLLDTVRPDVPADAVVVSPDLGAAKLAERYARALDLPVAVVHKIRLSGEEVRVTRVVGDVRGRTPLIVDDMISTGGTIEAAVAALLATGCRPPVVALATHALLVGSAIERLRAVPLRRLVVTDSLPLPDTGLPLRVVGLAPLLAQAIERLHAEQSLADLLAHG
jgi:ribose-phosphate pyrophosphokinase